MNQKDYIKKEVNRCYRETQKDIKGYEPYSVEWYKSMGEALGYMTVQEIIKRS